MTDTPTIQQALAAVMGDVRSVAKTDQNRAQGGGFMFRGIDAVMNAVGPALRKHGVIVTPHLDQIERREGRTAKGGTLNYVAVIVTYTFTGPAGDSLDATVPGEAFDSGDKATAKAMSVAFRTCLLQSLTLPTDEADPDADSYQATPHGAAGNAQEDPDAALKAEVHARWGNAGGLRDLRGWIAANRGQGHPSLTVLDARITELEALNA